MRPRRTWSHSNAPQRLALISSLCRPRPPFALSDAEALKRDAAGVVGCYFPDAPALYARQGWRLPMSIGRVYDASRIERVLGFRCHTDFGRVLDALRTGGRFPFSQDPGYVSPKEKFAAEQL